MSQTSPLLLLHFLAVLESTVSPPLSRLFPLGQPLEPKRVLLCSEVCVLLVPFARGQALFSVQVLRVYPNVQDLGVSARLSESGGADEERLHVRKDLSDEWND